VFIVLAPFFFPPPAPASGGELNRKYTLPKGVCQGVKNYSTSNFFLTFVLGYFSPEQEKI